MCVIKENSELKEGHQHTITIVYEKMQVSIEYEV